MSKVERDTAPIVLFACKSAEPDITGIRPYEKLKSRRKAAFMVVHSFPRFIY